MNDDQPAVRSNAILPLRPGKAEAGATHTASMQASAIVSGARHLRPVWRAASSSSSTRGELDPRAALRLAGGRSASSMRSQPW